MVVNLTLLEVDGAIRTKLEQRLGRVAPELDPRAVLMALDSELVEEQISHMVRLWKNSILLIKMIVVVVVAAAAAAAVFVVSACC